MLGFSKHSITLMNLKKKKIIHCRNFLNFDFLLSLSRMYFTLKSMGKAHFPFSIHWIP